MLSLSLLLVLSDDVLSFYTSFEVLLVVMYCYLALRVSTQRAAYAMLMLVVYTVCGSSLMACSYVLAYVAQGATCYATSVCHSAYGSLVGTAAVLMHVGLYCKLPAYPLHV